MGKFRVWRWSRWLVLLVVLWAGCTKKQETSTKQAHTLKEEELEILRVLGVSDSDAGFVVRFHLKLLGYRGKKLILRFSLRLRKPDGSYAFIEEINAATLTPKYNLQSYEDQRITIPYQDISVSPGGHRLFFDLKLTDSNAKVIAATLNKDFCLAKPDPQHPNMKVECGAAYSASMEYAEAPCSWRTSNACRVEKIGDISFGTRLIPAGSYVMGSPPTEQNRSTDETQHKVTLSRSFWMMETEVTQSLYQAVMGVNPASFHACGGACPVENVSWHEAALFANKLSQNQGLSPCFVCSGTTHEGVGGTGGCSGWFQSRAAYIACSGWRLPTEAEWEYAARAGTTAARYGDINDVAWYDGNSGNKTQPVGRKQPNPWGLFDMLGNVWEWCYDGYKGDLRQAATDPVEAATGTHRVLRGGGWDGGAYGVRAARRSTFASSSRDGSIGFRVVRSSP